MSVTQPDGTVSISPDEVDFFRGNGFLRVDEITSQDEVTFLRDVYDDVMANPGALRLIYEGDGSDGATINQVFLPERQRPELADTGYFRNGKRAAAALLGIAEDEVVPGGLMLIYKPPTGGREAPWHQDEAFWNDRNHLKCNSLSVWMPLDEAVVESGCMQFLPGTHVNDVLLHRNQPGDPLVVDAPIDTSTAVPCPLPPGGATFHHCRTLHHTAKNTSGRPRRAMTTIFHGPAETRDVALEKPWLQ